MSDEQFTQLLSSVPIDRRTFVRRLVAGTAFAVPMVASFGMSTASVGAARTANQLCATANQTDPNSIASILAAMLSEARASGNTALATIITNAQREFGKGRLETVQDLMEQFLLVTGAYVRAGRISAPNANCLIDQANAVIALTKQQQFA